MDKLPLLFIFLLVGLVIVMLTVSHKVLQALLAVCFGALMIVFAFLIPTVSAKPARVRAR